MTDYFALLGQPRRPWLDVEQLKTRFHALAAQHHPDIAGPGAAIDFPALNAAHAALRDPRSRLRHLIELEAPELLEAHAQPPAGAVEFFSPMAGFRGALDEFLARHSAAKSPVAQALLADEQFTLAHRAQALLARLDARRATLMTAIRELDALWQRNPAGTAPQLAEIQAELSYLANWSAQLREALFKLAVQP